MANHRLRGAMLNAGMTTAALALVADVDVKSVSRWITEDRLPHTATRTSVARALGQEETFLWPAVLEPTDGTNISSVEVERVWPTRSAISSETWHALFSRTTQELDIQVYAGAFLIETLDLADVLGWKASNGTRIRVLIGDPEGSAVLRRAKELAAEWLPARCSTTLEYLRRVAGISVRAHDTIHYASIFRFDDIVLANTHAFGVWACHSPVQQVRRVYSSSHFDFWKCAFERAWLRSG